MNNRGLITGIALVAVGAVLTLAYDFDDPEFNQLLAIDLEELHNAYSDDILPSHPRNRRDEEVAKDDPEKCRPRKKKFCCAEETLEAAHEQDKELKKECFKEVIGKNKDSNKEPRGEFDPFRCDKIEKHRKEMTCVFQCLGQKKGLLDEEGNLKETELNDQVKTLMAKEEWFAPLQEGIVSRCIAEAKNATSGRQTADISDPESCNPAGVKLMHCLFREIQLGCPADQIKDQKACTRTRDKIKRHNDFFPVVPSSSLMHDE